MKKLFYMILLLLLTLPSAAAVQKHQRLKVGLVLGGGGAKGAAEVGVLKYIEKSGIPIDYIAGTSIGSIVGGMYACGYKAADLDSMFNSQKWINLLTDRNTSYDTDFIHVDNGTAYVFGFPVTKFSFSDFKPGIIRGDSVVALFNEKTQRPDSMSFDDLPIPFRCVAVDVKRIKEVVLSHGVLSTAMRASMAIPGVFKPVALDSTLLIDGGALNNLPVDVVRDMGADVVIAIDLTQNKREARDKDMKPKKGLGLLLEWIKVRPDLEKYNENVKNCDVYINPNLKGYDAASFTTGKIKKMIELGEEAGKDAESDLKKLKKIVMKGKP